MELKREKLPSYFLPVFILWVGLTNVAAIIVGIVLYSRNIEMFGARPGLILGVVIAINILSIILLYPLFSMDPIKPFLIPALIWFAIVTATYILLGLYWLVILTVVQLAADLWFEWMARKLRT